MRLKEQAIEKWLYRQNSDEKGLDRFLKGRATMMQRDTFLHVYRPRLHDKLCCGVPRRKKRAI